MRVIAVIQARMGSTRLFGKVLSYIGHKPLLVHIIDRLKECRKIDEIFVATTTNKIDDLIEMFCAEEGVNCIRGDEEDVLSRFQLAMDTSPATYIVRVTGDTPFIDPEFVDHLITLIDYKRLEFVYAAQGLHDGVDVFSWFALDKLIAANDPFAREHVSSYLKTHPLVHMGCVEDYPGLLRRQVDFSIDTPRDLEFVRDLYAYLGAPTLREVQQLFWDSW